MNSKRKTVTVTVRQISQRPAYGHVTQVLTATRPKQVVVQSLRVPSHLITADVKDGPTVRVGDVPDVELIDLADSYRRELLAKAAAQRAVDDSEKPEPVAS